MTLPAIDDIDTLGGVLQNEDPIEDPLTQISAELDNINRANTAMMTHTLVRAMRAFIGGAVPTDPLTLLVHDAVWGSTAPVKPTVTQSATGVHDVTWPTTVDDELGESHTVNFRNAFASVDGTVPIFTTATVTSANVVQVRTFSQAGALVDPAGVITVHAY